MIRSFGNILFGRGLALFLLLSVSVSLSAADALPGIKFTPNFGQLAGPDGQTMPSIEYYGHAGDLSVFFQKDRLIFMERQQYRIESQESAQARAEGHNTLADELEVRYKFYRFDMVFDGTKGATTIEPLGELLGHTNYYLGHCPDGIKNVPSYRSILYHDLYPGISLVYKNTAAGLKYEFYVEPGVDPSQIQWHYEGLKNKQLLEDGSLQIKAAIHTLTDSAPYSYLQEDNLEVNSRFKKIDNGAVGFELGKYNKNATLIIDPSLTWSTYFDGNGTWDAISFTSTGDWFSAAYMYSSAIPPFFDAGTWYDNSHAGGTDMCIVKFGNDGEQLWTTYYGGSSFEYHINNTGAVDDNNNFYLCGQTSSNDWPLYNPGGGAYYDGTRNSSEAFILKFDEDGTRLWSTFFGGSSGDRIRGVTTHNNELLIVGETYSTDLPVQSSGSAYYDATQNGSEDAFIARFNSSGTKQWCTYFGGSGAEDFVDIWVDPTNNNLYCVGEISGWSSPTTYPPLTNPGGGAYFDNTVNGKQDIIIAKFNSSRQLTWSTIYGGQYNDNINGDCGGVRTDSDGNIYIVGKTMSDNLPMQNPGGGAYYQSTLGNPGDNGNDGFLLKFNSNGVRQWATYYGGSGSEEIRKVKIDLDDNIWLGAYTGSSNIPLQTQTGSYNQTLSGSYDALFIKFNQSGVRQWASCYGGTGVEFCRPFGIYQESTCGIQLFAMDYTNSLNLPLDDPGGNAYYDNTRTATTASFIFRMEEDGGGGAATGTITWTGAVSEDWFEPCNWDKSAVPTASNPVVIPAGTTNKPHINDNSKGNANCYTIEIESGSANGGHLYLNSSAGGRLNITKP